jgi:predicted ester cyclase
VFPAPAAEAAAQEPFSVIENLSEEASQSRFSQCLSGKQLQFGGISISAGNGRIAEHWEQLDRLALVQQLGVVPADTTEISMCG